MPENALSPASPGGTGPTMDEWLRSIEDSRIPDMTRQWIVQTIRELRDADDPRDVTLAADLQRQRTDATNRPSMADLLSRADRRRGIASATTEEIVNALHAGREERDQHLRST